MVSKLEGAEWIQALSHCQRNYGGIFSKLRTPEISAWCDEPVAIDLPVLMMRWLGAE